MSNLCFRPIIRWNSLGYHLHTQNKDQFLSTDFGFKEFNVKSEKERIRRYRRYVYEAGAINRPGKMQAKVINEKVVAEERKKEFGWRVRDLFKINSNEIVCENIIQMKRRDN